MMSSLASAALAPGRRPPASAGPTGPRPPAPSRGGPPRPPPRRRRSRRSPARAGSRPGTRARRPRLPPPARARGWGISRACSRGLQGGQLHPEEGPAALPRENRQLALVLPDDRGADREAEAGGILGREERLQDPLPVRLREPRP